MGFQLRMKMLKEERQNQTRDQAVFPCALQIYEQHVFNSRNPILVGCQVLDGQVRIGTPICVPTADRIVIGKITSIEHDHKQVDKARKGDDVAVKIEQTAG